MSDSSTLIKRPLYLASQSPRRLALLQGLASELNLEVKVLVPEEAEKADAEALEAALPGESARDYVMRVARAKALDGWARSARRGLPPALLLASDTTVALHGQILGKPHSAAHARRLLKGLSGQTHVVMTAVWLARPQSDASNGTPLLTSALSVSEVDFDVLSDDWIDWVISTGEPMDKAGAYALQGHAASVVKAVRGSPSGIIGLPVRETRTLLLEALA